MSNQSASNRGDFVTALREQPQRVLTALGEEETVDATPILREDEEAVLSCEGYITLVYELHHVHLPELETAGLVEFDPRAGTVMRGPRFNQTRPLLRHGDDC